MISPQMTTNLNVVDSWGMLKEALGAILHPGPKSRPPPPHGNEYTSRDRHRWGVHVGVELKQDINQYSSYIITLQIGVKLITLTESNKL